MKHRIVEFRPDRYMVERKRVLLWRPLGRPPFQFVTVKAAEEAIELDRLNRLQKKLLRAWKRKVVKVL